MVSYGFYALDYSNPPFWGNEGWVGGYPETGKPSLSLFPFEFQGASTNEGWDEQRVFFHLGICGGVDVHVRLTDRRGTGSPGASYV